MKRLTKAQLNGLAVLAEGDRSSRPVYVSNFTTRRDLLTNPGYALRVYWQTARTLADAGLARHVDAFVVVLTDEGRKLAAELSQPTTRRAER